MRVWLLVAGLILVVVALALVLGWPGGKAPTSTSSSPSTSSTTAVTSPSSTLSTTTMMTSVTETATETTTTAPGGLKTLSPLSRVLVAHVSEQGVWYVEEIVYSENGFRVVTSNWGSVSNQLLGEFLSRIKGYEIRVENLSIKAIPTNNSVVITCIVRGCVWNTTTGYYADMSWLIRPFGLDFIDSGFTETNHSLEWSGVIDGVETTIIVSLPPQKTPYKAWQHPTGHCHAHVWWSAENS